MMKLQLLAVFLVAFNFNLWAASGDADLEAASRFVSQKAAESRGDLLNENEDAASALKLERFYKIGDRWVMAVSHRSYDFMRMTDETGHATERFLEPLFYEFRVTATDSSAGSAEVTVVRVEADGKPASGERVTKVVLKINRKMSLVSKQYFYKGAEKPVEASLGALQNVPMGFDSFPIDLPDFEKARMLRSHIYSAPNSTSMIPGTLTALSKRRPINESETLSFESTDLFQRKIRFAWQKGDLWPAFVDTKSGVSILILQEKI